MGLCYRIARDHSPGGQDGDLGYDWGSRIKGRDHAVGQAAAPHGAITSASSLSLGTASGAGSAPLR